MKKMCLILFSLLFVAFPCFSNKVLAEATAIAFLNNGQNVGSYRIGFSSTSIDYLTDNPTVPVADDLKIDVSPGEYSGKNEKIFLFFQIISTNKDLKLKLNLSMVPLTCNGKEIDWRIRWNPIEGLVDGGFIATGKLKGETGLESKDIYTFVRTDDRISVADSLQLFVETEPVSEHTNVQNEEYKGKVTLTISSST